MMNEYDNQSTPNSNPKVRLPKKDAVDMLLDTVELYHPGYVDPNEPFHPAVEAARQKAIEETQISTQGY